jgi:hypothetical protein
MTSLSALMRRFSIHLRMLGAIAMVLGLFALVGTIGLLSGRHLAELNTDFMHHSLKEVRNVADALTKLGEVRRHEKDMVIHYEDGVAVLKAREAWSAALAQSRAAFTSMLEGEEDEDNPLAREALKELSAYEAATVKVLEQIQNGAYDTAIAADKMLARAKQHISMVEDRIAAIDLSSGADGTVFNFGEVQLSFISGLVWVDKDRDTTLDTAEAARLGGVLDRLRHAMHPAARAAGGAEAPSLTFRARARARARQRVGAAVRASASARANASASASASARATDMRATQAQG